MSLQGGAFKESFAALFARVRAKANVLVVDVSSQAEHGDVGRTAHFTGVRSLAGVFPPVDLQLAREREGFVADAAYKGFFSL